jgi:hypothetical protein
MPQMSMVVAIPGQVVQLATSSTATNTITFSWQSPLSGGAPTSYIIQYRQTGSTTWIFNSTVVVGTSFQLVGLQPSSSYDIQVAASNDSGVGAVSQTLTVSTAAVTVAQVALPNQVSGLAAVPTSNSSIQLTWSGQTGANAATTYTVQYRATGATAWASSIPGITTVSNSVSGLQSATGYDFLVFGVNSSGAGVASLIVSAATQAVGSAVSAITWNLAPSGTYAQSSGAIGVNAHSSPSSAAIQFGFSMSSTLPPSSWTAGLHVNTDLWGAYVSTPSTVGNWYAWVEGTDGSSPTPFPTPFVVQ